MPARSQPGLAKTLTPSPCISTTCSMDAGPHRQDIQASRGQTWSHGLGADLDAADVLDSRCAVHQRIVAAKVVIEDRTLGHRRAERRRSCLAVGNAPRLDQATQEQGMRRGRADGDPRLRLAASAACAAIGPTRRSAPCPDIDLMGQAGTPAAKGPPRIETAHQ